jgi:hypothetical protein
MGWRTAHGRNKSQGDVVSIEVQPADELSVPNASDMDTRLAERKRIGRPFQPGNKAARGRKPKLARLGIDKDTIKASSTLYSNYLRQAEMYRVRRIQELRIAHGFVSVAAASLVATAALALAGSRYLSALAVQSDFPDMDMLKKSAELATQARQNELAAWELCSREASAKTRASANETPWMKARVAVEPEPLEEQAEPKKQLFVR